MVGGTSLPSGSRLGKYEILRPIGVGGMAELYLARVRLVDGLEKNVALKRILPAYANDGEFIRLFLDEARMAASLQHPGIVQVFDVDRLGPDLFFTMEYVEGETLRSMSSRAERTGTSIPLAEAMEIALHVAAALHHAHERGVVHRDVSPTNVLVSYEGAVKLVDFGIAKAASKHSVTRVGTVRGNPIYMSPEQAAGRSVDRKTDVFSLGLVIYELMTGRLPFEGDSAVAVALKLATLDAPPLSHFRPDVPLAVDRVLAGALAREPDARYASAEAFYSALEGACREERLSSSPMALARWMKLTFGEPAAFDAEANVDDSPTGTAAVLTPPLTQPVGVERRPRRIPLLVSVIALASIGAAGIGIGLRSRVIPAEDRRVTAPAATAIAEPPELPSASAPIASPSAKPPKPAPHVVRVDDPDAPLPAGGGHVRAKPHRRSSSDSPLP
jgi:eukaryotic-like serine/threonine-protein kinase